MANEYFGKVSEKGIQILVIRVSGATFTTLAAGVGQPIDSNLKGITRNMLVKKVKIMGYINGMAANQPIIVAMGANDSGVAGGFNASTDAALIDPEASAAYLAIQETVRTIWHETSTCMVEGPTDGSGGAKISINETFSVGGGKGIPCMAGAGPELFVFNPADSNLTTGGEFIGVYVVYGVWLED